MWVFQFCSLYNAVECCWDQFSNPSTESQTHLTLALFQSNDTLLASLASDMQLHLDTLASEQTSCLIANLGLQPVCGMVAEHQGWVFVFPGCIYVWIIAVFYQNKQM